MKIRSCTFSSITSSKISRRFALYVVVVGLFIALMISVLAVYRNYHNDLAELHKELAQVERSIKSSLVHNMWQVNLEALNIIVNDLLVDKDIVFVELLDEQGNTLIKKGIKPHQDAIEKSTPLYHSHDGKKVYLGTFHYIATPEEVDERNERSVLRAVTAIVVFFLILSLAILYHYWDSTAKHLLTIKRYADKLRQGGFKDKKLGTLVLDRSVGKKEGKDELDELVGTINDMHHEIVEKYTAIEYQSLHDALTELPNRRMIGKRISEVIEECRAANGYAALLYIDLDHFKLMNDSMGHTVGDKVLQEIAGRLTTVGEKGFLPARISGDDFLMLQTDISSDRGEARALAESFAQRLLAEISHVIMIDGYPFKNTASIGIALLDAKATPEVIIKQADNALYHAKEKGRGSVSVFEPEMQQHIDKKLQLEQLTDKAIEKGLLFINYQPKYNHQRKIKSAEALVRMYDEQGNIVSPGDFIPILEETGNIVEIGDHIIEKVFGFLDNNQDLIRQSDLESIAINVSPTQYNSPGFADRVIAYAEQFNIDPKQIILEITEEVVAGSIQNVVAIMDQLTRYGFRFSIDDFGTGYSSLRYLKNLPLDELKIDKSFVDEITTDEKANAIVKTIIDMAHNLRLDVVAEGVETEDQLTILEQYPCEMYQGFFFSRPLMEEDFLSILQADNS